MYKNMSVSQLLKYRYTSVFFLSTVSTVYGNCHYVATLPPNITTNRTDDGEEIHLSSAEPDVKKNKQLRR